MALVFVDIDKTLLDISSERYFFYYLLKKRQLKFKQFYRFVTFIVKYFHRYRQHTLKKNKAYLCGLSTYHVKTLCEHYVSEVLYQHLREEMIDKINQHLQSNDTVVLLSGTLDYLAKALAKRLNIQKVVATKCSIDSHHRFTAKPPALHPFGTDKLTLATKLADHYHTTLDKSSAYGDSIYDLALLLAVKTPVVVYADNALRTIAKQKSWQMIG